MRPSASAVLLCLLSVTSFCSDPPPLKPVVIARTVPPAGVDAPAIQLDQWETSQRYVALVPTTAEILTFDYTDPSVVEVINRSPNEKFYGVPWDSPVGAKSADKNFPDAKGMVAIVVGKNPGTCTVSVWAVKNGAAVKVDTVQIVVGPRPPPPSPITLTATPSTGNAPLTVQFTSTGDPTVLMGGTLDYGDGTPASIFLQSLHTYAAAGTYTAKLTASGKTASAVVVVSGTPVPPVVTSFRVIFVTESAVTLTAQQSSVINAKTTRDYLNAKCTKENNLPDWRGYDPNVTAANEYSGIKSLWTAVKPKLTVIPCWTIEVNGKAEILPFPATAAEALTTLQSYGGK